MPAPEEMSRDELIRLVVERDAQIAARDGQIAVMAGQLSELVEANEVLTGKLARLEYFWSTCCRGTARTRRVLPRKTMIPGRPRRR